MSDRIVASVSLVRMDDFASLARFLEENDRPEITRYFRPFPLTSQTAHDIACTDHLDRYYLALYRDHVVGLCMLRGWDEGFDVPSFGIFVDHRYDGLGLGRQLTEHAIGDARSLGCERIRLSVFARNERAVHLYTSLGFYEVDRQPVLVAGEKDEKIIMIKDLR